MLDIVKKEVQADLKLETEIFPELQEENNYQDMSINSHNDGHERYFAIDANALMNKKRNNYDPTKKSCKLRNDNLKRKCKHLVIENVLQFINNKIFEVYKGNIGDGLLIKKLFKLNQSPIINTDAQFNKNFITKTLKDILSQNITNHMTSFDINHNKKVIETIIMEKKEEFEKLFNLTFIDCLQHFIGNHKIEELNGLTLFSELKEEIISKNIKDGEYYYEKLRLFLIGFENIIKNTKPRKKRKKGIPDS